MIRHTLQQLRQPPHPWWHHLPPEQRRRRHRAKLLGRRLLIWLRQRRQLIVVTAAFYLLLCLFPVFMGLHGLSLVALLPIVLVPPVGYLIYWLVWKEFHH